MDTPLTVGAVMTRKPFRVSPETEFTDIAALLTSEKISAVPVVEGDVPIGVVSEEDLLCAQDGALSPGALSSGVRLLVGGRRARREHRKARAHRARELMTAPAPTVDISTTVSRAAHELAARGLRRFFVVQEGQLAGVVSRGDLLDVFLRPDCDVRHEIESEVFGRVLRAEPTTFTVTVDRGVVTVLGRLERRSAVSSVGRLIPLVSGVVGVHNRLDYVWDDEAT
ncbi:MAG TPA: CBS domain-containing protein [Amycolatopsis sp.]|jgi:CBS domain-containing protein|nr:CBS domain-containing protein [Amycolatopsis sp.]